MSLKREVTFFGVFSLAVGAMISSGLFILPSLAFAQAGPAAIVSYFLAGLLAMVGSFSIIELATAMPKAGGDYYFVTRSLGPLLGTLSGILGWLALSLKSAFAIFGIAEVLHILLGWNQLIVGVIFIAFFVALNIKGVKEAAKLQDALVIMLLALLLIFVFTSIPKLDMENYKPFVSHGTASIFTTTGFVFISFGGLLKIANLAEEIENPKKNIPLGMIASIVVVTVLYTLVLFALTGSLTADGFEGSLAPVADAAGKNMGVIGYALMTIASSFAFITTANAGILASSRYPFSLARDGLLPQFFVKSNKKGMPVVAILITAVVIFVALLVDLESLVKVASSVILVSYVLTNISVIVLRESKLKSYKPSFKAPLYPFLQIANIIIFSILIINMGGKVLDLSLILIFACFLLYIFYGMKNSTGESAFLHLLRRIADERLTEGLLESELEEIILERDGLESRFNDIVSRAKIIEINEHLDFDELLDKVFSNEDFRYSISKERLIKEFVAREEEASTVLNDLVAVPHIIDDKITQMEMIIARCPKGVEFNRQDKNIKAIFFLLGPMNQRDNHLLCLSRIARKVNVDDFCDIWDNLNIEEFMKECKATKED